MADRAIGHFFFRGDLVKGVCQCAGQAGRFGQRLQMRGAEGGIVKKARLQQRLIHMRHGIGRGLQAGVVTAQEIGDIVVVKGAGGRA